MADDHLGVFSAIRESFVNIDFIIYLLYPHVWMTLIQESSTRGARDTCVTTRTELMGGEREDVIKTALRGLSMFD